jgi:hypothetical protein
MDDQIEKQMSRSSALFRLGFQLILAPFAIAFALLMLFVCFVIIRAVASM